MISSRLHRSFLRLRFRRFFHSALMSQAQNIAPARSDPSSGSATPLGSEPSLGSKSAGVSQDFRLSYLAKHGPLHCTAKKEAKRLEKETKLAAKAAKAATLTPAGEKKAKEKVAKSEDVPFVNTTPRGKKKGVLTYMLQSADLIQVL